MSDPKIYLADSKLEQLTPLERQLLVRSLHQMWISMSCATPVSREQIRAYLEGILLETDTPLADNLIDSITDEVWRLQYARTPRTS